MRKPVVYSGKARVSGQAAPTSAGSMVPPAWFDTTVAAQLPRWRQGLARAVVNPRVLWSLMGLVAIVFLSLQWLSASSPSRELTQKDIDAAVLRTLSTQALPSATARAAERIRPSVVQVLAYGRDAKGERVERGEGTGVVIVDTGVILTNLHVVQGGAELVVVFADGSESAALVTGVQAKDDLAVLQAATIPDDLEAATLRSTHDLNPGDGVVAVGFPFGIGPSVSAGVVSGLGRSFQSPDGQQELSNLIQFDAAANPGNSGGPLVTLDGEVVGIVTGILNPTRNRTFLGIGFAVPIENAAGAAGQPPF